VLSLAACTQPQRVGVSVDPVKMPLWTRDGKHPDFPASTHLAAYASGDDAQRARANADALLESTIVRYALSLGERQLANTRFAQIVTGQADWITLSDFGNSVARDAASDGFETVAVSALNMEELRFRSVPLLQQAKLKLPSTLEPPEVDDINKRVAAWSERFVLSARVLALSLLCGELDRDAHALAERAAIELNELATHMDVTQTGANQAARLMGGAQHELQLSALYRGRMPSSFKVAWFVEAPSVGVLSGFTEFNLTGQAYCRVLSLSSTGQEYAAVHCVPDLDAMAGRKLGIAAAGWRWLVAVPSRKNVLLSFDVKERLGPNATTPVFSEACVTWSRLNEVSLHDDIAPKDRARFLYAVAIEGYIDVTVRRQRGLNVAHASGQVVLRDAGSNAVLFRYAPSVIIEGGDDADTSELVLQAQREAAGDVLLEFGARILGLFPLAQERP
jgi:hypothetical protein